MIERTVFQRAEQLGHDLHGGKGIGRKVERQRDARPRQCADGNSGEDQPERTLRSEEHTSELQSLMRISYAVFCLKKKKNKQYKIPPSNYTKKVMTTI